MANTDNFNSVEELYKRLLPALNTKINELKRKHITVTTIDIWNYCLENNWKNERDLRIYKMVDNILNLDELRFYRYIKNNNKKEW